MGLLETWKYGIFTGSRQEDASEILVGLFSERKRDL